MDSNKVKETVDASFDSVFATWSRQIEKDLYPSAFADPYSWLKIKNSLDKNNQFLKEALKSTLIELLCED